MKKIFALMAVCTMVFAANAQIVSSNSRVLTITKEKVPSRNYSRLFVAYAPLSFSGDAGKDADAISGVALGWIKGSSISKEIPLYLEWGLYAKYNSKSEEDSRSDGWGGTYTEKNSVKYFSATVPFSLAYKYDIPGAEGVSLIPYLGLHARVNIIGEDKYETSGSSTESTRDHFDSTEIEGYKIDGANRFQFGWQIGVGFNYKALHLGLAYSAEFTEYSKKLNTGGVMLSLGVNF